MKLLQTHHFCVHKSLQSNYLNSPSFASSIASIQFHAYYLRHNHLRGGDCTYRLDVSAKKGGLLVFVNMDIPSEYLQSFNLPGQVRAVPFEKTLKQRKLFAVSTY